MGSRWLGIVVDSRDPARLARWWAEVLGFRVTVEKPDLVAIAGADDSHPAITFVPVSDEKTGKNRLHLDLAPDDQSAEIERLLDMGARHAEIGQPPGTGWMVLADPEGNEFCLLPPQKPGSAG
jgi:predicted enzyme related to lactoylglutathione lyase